MINWLTKRCTNPRTSQPESKESQNGKIKKKRKLLRQPPVSWGSNLTASCAKEENPGSQPMLSSFQPEHLLLGCICPFSANELQLSFSVSIKKKIFHCFYFFHIVSAGEGTSITVHTENVPLRVPRTSFSFIYRRCYTEILSRML